MRQVKRAMTEAEYQRMSAMARRDWWPVIRQALREWEEADHPGSVVEHGWMPVQVLADLFAEHGHTDLDVLTATIFKLEQMTGDIVQRTIVIDGVAWPVVKLTGFGREATTAITASKPALPPERAALDPARPALPPG